LSHRCGPALSLLFLLVAILLPPGCDPAERPHGPPPPPARAGSAGGSVSADPPRAPAAPGDPSTSTSTSTSQATEPAPGEEQLRQAISLALQGWDVPRALNAYEQLRRGRGEDDFGLLRDIAWRYLSAAVIHGEQWTLAERREAIGAIGRSNHPEALPLLGQLLADPSWELRWTVLEAIAANDGPAATELLARGGADQDRRVRCAAGSLLLQRQDTRGFAPALECGEPAELRYRALRLLLEQAADVPFAVLQRTARHQAQEPRLAIAAVLAVRGRRSAERSLLLELEQDPKPLVKRAARCGLAVLDHGAGRAELALAPFRQLLRGGEEQRLTAVFLLGLMGRRLGPAAVRLLEEQLDPLQPALSGQVCIALAHLGRAEGLETLARVLQREHPPEVQRKAAMALGRIGGARAVSLLLDLLQDQQVHPLVKDVALSAAAALGDPRAAPAIARLALHGDPRLVGAAASSLAALPASPAASAALRELLSSPLASARSLAALGLAAQNDRAVLPLLAPLLGDRERAVQYYAAAAIVRLEP